MSIMVHIGVGIGLYVLPESGREKPAPFLASLVSPDEIRIPSRKPVAPLPAVKKPVPSRLARRPSALTVPPRELSAPHKPAVPGMGKETGKPLPEGILPKAGEKDAGGAEEKSSSGPGSSSDRGHGDRPGFPGRKGLYDPEIIGDIAMKETVRTPKRDESITFDTSDYRYAGYMRKLKEKIESIWVYPPEARASNLYGDLKIRFTIRKNGRLGSVELVRTSGYKILDDAAIKALQDGEPYWPIPEEWGMDSYTILGHFIYAIYGYSVR